MKKKKWAVLGALVAAGVLVVLLTVRLAGITEAQKAEAYLKNCIMVGDSVTVGFQNYCAKSDQNMWKQLRFLASVSLSAHNALWPVSEKSTHPLYQGEQRPVWESISMMGAKDVFISLGLNDLNIVDDTCVYYQELADKIQTWSPGTRIHVISVTYVLKEGEKNEVRNVNIQELNEKLKVLADRNGWGFLDLASPLSDGEGGLREEYCSDGYVHQTAQAYEVWEEVLYAYIKEQITGNSRGKTREPAPEAIYQAVRAAVELPPMTEKDDAFIRDYYGIDPDLLDSYVLALAEDPVLAETIFIMRAKDPKDVEALADAAGAVGKQKAAEMRNYEVPEQYQIAAESEVRTKGRYVYLVISQAAEDAEEIIEEELERP